jgi:23S rRNA (guanosine2251-2'-O)-methyltransferase
MACPGGGEQLKDAMQMIYGINPLMESLHGDPAGISRIIIAVGRKGPPVDKILEMASCHGINVSFQDHAALDRLAGRVAHQGVVGLCRPYTYATLDEIMANSHPALQGKVILLVDGVTDPQNLGALIRTAHCFGVSGVVIPAHRAASVTPTVMKASAGALRYTPVAMEANLGQTIDVLKENQYWIYGAEAGADHDMAAVQFEGRIGLVVGAEGKGIRPLVKRKCDFLVSMPMVGKINSLNVSVAAGIMLYAIFRALKRRE